MLLAMKRVQKKKNPEAVYLAHLLAGRVLQDALAVSPSFKPCAPPAPLLRSLRTASAGIALNTDI